MSDPRTLNSFMLLIYLPSSPLPFIPATAQQDAAATDGRAGSPPSVEPVHRLRPSTSGNASDGGPGPG